MSDVGTVMFTLTLPAEFVQEADVVVGRFPHLDVASQGRNRAEAEHNLIEAAQLFIESCYERNVLDEVLKSCGFVPGHAAQAASVSHLTVPVELLAAQNGPASRAG